MTEHDLQELRNNGFDDIALYIETLEEALRNIAMTTELDDLVREAVAIKHFVEAHKLERT